MKKHLLYLAASAMLTMNVSAQNTGAADSGAKLAPASVTVNDEGVITDVEGTEKQYLRYSVAYDMYNYEVTNAGGVVTSIVFDEDGTTAYIYDPLQSYPCDSYVKATVRDNGDLVVAGHQLLWSEYGEEDYLDLLRQPDAASDYEVVEDAEIVYEKVGDGYRLKLGEGELLGVTTDEYGWGVYTWLGYADEVSQLSAWGAEQQAVATLPADAKGELWRLQTAKNDTAYVHVSVKGDRMYLTQMPDVKSDACVVGTIKDGKVEFATGQYVGMSSQGRAVFFNNASIQLNDAGQSVFGGFNDEALTFSYDEESRVLTCDEASWVFTNGNGVADFVSWAIAPKLSGINTAVAVPQQPAIYAYNDYDEESEQGCLYISIPMVAADNTELNPGYLYYRVYMGQDAKEPFTFKPEDYNGLTEAMTDVPYLYTDGVYFNQFENSQGFSYLTEQTVVGVQAVYKYDGQERVSAITWFDVKEHDIATAVAALKAEAQPSGSAVYNMAGQRVAGTSRGIYVVNGRKYAM